MAAAAKPQRVNERRRFTDGGRARLSIVLRKFKTGFLTYAEHRPKDAERTQRGMVEQHDTEQQAREAYARLVRDAERDGWRERRVVPESEFTALPTAAPAAARPRQAAASTAQPRRRAS